MVQVDVFWSYAIGSSFALSAFRQLRKITREKPPETGDFNWRDFRRMLREIETGGVAFHNQYFLKTLLFLSLLFVPSGAVLLWSNPEWETMQVGRYETIPGWLVGAFTITNVTQGILGYWVTYNLLMKGRYFRAALQTVLSYFGFWFILVNGWDKAGYRRFFSRSRKEFENWRPSNALRWLVSDVVRILLVFGIGFIPLMLYWTSKWLIEGAESKGIIKPLDDEERNRRMLKLSVKLLGAVAGTTLGLAICSTILIRKLGWILGAAASAALCYAVVFREGSTARKLTEEIMMVDTLEAPSVLEG